MLRATWNTRFLYSVTTRDEVIAMATRTTAPSIQAGCLSSEPPTAVRTTATIAPIVAGICQRIVSYCACHPSTVPTE